MLFNVCLITMYLLTAACAKQSVCLFVVCHWAKNYLNLLYTCLCIIKQLITIPHIGFFTEVAPNENDRYVCLRAVGGCSSTIGRSLYPYYFTMYSLACLHSQLHRNYCYEGAQQCDS